MPDRHIILLRRLLAAYYRPKGLRLGIVLSSGCADDDVAAAAADTLTAHGQPPPRRLARLHPRPGEPGPRPADIADFLRKYGHEYAAAWLPAPAGEADLASITAAARGAGCAIGWDLTGGGHPGSGGEARLREWGMDFALWSAPGDLTGEVRVYTREPSAPLSR
ncbi:hypothetical protein ABZ260_46880 [Streptosporangium sp. NPDC006013]|uniref:hypothetical protein n=1 Tax=Streptosporangium sp. NPDC006013 TaxID=3155596 RepID=UPI0033B6E473